MKTALTIAGSDSSGGAGIQADIKTFSALGLFGMSVITAVTAQNTQGVFAVQNIDTDVIMKQIDAIYEDIPVDAVKIGMAADVGIIKTIVARLTSHQAKNIVVDPVMVSKSGYRLLNSDAEETLIQELLPLARIVTPNIFEAQVITKLDIVNLAGMEKAAQLIFDMGPKNVLVKGGPLDENATDVLYDGKEFKYLTSKRIATKNTHGTGCTLSSAIAAYLGMGYPVIEAVSAAKAYITTAIEHAMSIGKGVGPTHHFYDLYKKAGLLTD
jgi:hydroxymethylpyrimidine/phosphomethylpyrimidine kinase